MSYTALDFAVRVALTAGSAVLFSIMLLAYRRTKSKKLLFISAGFGIFFAHALITIPELLSGAVFMNETTDLMIDLIVLFFVLLGTLRR